MIDQDYIGPSSRVFFMQFTLYDSLSDYFIVFDMMVEFLVSGNVFPTYIKILPFKANLFELSGEKLLQAMDIFRFILCLYLIFQIYLKLRYHMPKVSLLSVDVEEEQEGASSRQPQQD